ncbi:UDP-glucuronate 5'-epimerase [Afipia carboxidovorans OM5]|uniref:NAD-dependent epimerase/dehydratase family n=2 Tax=Afipia carboxidovorans TaxID=40137 RepID=B6JBC8_AFIC5|nr:UDP-glucuronate 5'-epimerase [Afipia carboxidovorans OM5]AEI03757.1 NAD-dependent epimerase/dehydratase family [Afipia carboxidovorans OM4]AEI07334.1 NAD-dependent epimerase/dehydratase family [Afipia carboxidovorans OM5]
MMSKKTILVTGAAGFIGFHVAQRLLQAGHEVIGLDNINDYYDPALKEARLAILKNARGFAFEKIDLADRAAVRALFETHRFPLVIHLAAQAGVRYSIDHPNVYIDSNLQGFANILEGCRHNGCEHLLFASSSSVYGANTKLPFSEHDSVNHPISLYAASKRANELMAHTYSHLYGLPATGLRFFTVYGPWGRPDMAMYLFANAIVADKPIRLFNNGDMLRDFTYVDDVTEAVVRLAQRPAKPNPAWNPEAPDPATSHAPWRIYNIGNNKPEKLMDLVAAMERELGRTARKELLPMQAGDVYATYADIEDLRREVDFRPDTPLADGVARFVAWYRQYHRI